MKPIDYVIIGVVAVAVIAIVIHLVKRKKAGISDCGCGCESCPSAGACHGARIVQKEKENE